ncbi:MAG: Hsp20/alpha crystallin family protein [Candidatus Diapherotrites archaeon]|nr:Hsp20/alpha crystallin family protein [Candidatus Diapherotrites archaeon]
MFYDPFEELRRLHRELDRFFGQVFGRIGSPVMIREPAIDLIDEGDHFLLVVELPGVKKEDVELYVNRDSVTIKAEKRGREEKKGGNYYVRERVYSAFYRTITLPEPVIPEETKARFNNGVLEVILKKERPRLEGEEKGYRVKIE